MARHQEHAPGDAAAAAGVYEQLNVFGRPTGIRVALTHGHPLPNAPIGHSWMLIDEDTASDPAG
jgi:hypothetical protein